MGQIHSFDEVEHATITPADGVPMLDWPGDLFSHNASVADLVCFRAIRDSCRIFEKARSCALNSPPDRFVR